MEYRAIKPDECTHLELQFGSGDYYIFCHACGASWMRRGFMKQEYGTDSNGTEVGGAPEEANKGIGATLSGQIRRNA